jgi:hypothetical protein
MIDYKLKPGDFVNVISDQIKKTFGITSDQVFEVKTVLADGVKLNNGWTIGYGWIQPVTKQSKENKGDNKLKDVSRETLEEYIRNVLDDFIDQKFAFTVLNVADEVRNRNPDINVPHNVVRSYVEHHYFDDYLEEFTGGNVEYTRKTINIGSPPPYLYYPKDYDPSKFKANSGPQETQVKTDGAPQSFKFVTVFGKSKGNK